MLVREIFINLTEGYRFNADGPYPTDLDASEVYRRSQREYGRCTSKVYIDVPNGPPIPHGWVFVSRDRYDDCNETYLREVWVVLLNEDGSPYDLRSKRTGRQLATAR